MRGRIRYVDVDEALDRVRASLDIRPAPEACPIDMAYGRVLAEDVVSPANVPRFDSSHRDGYAIRSQDTVKASRDDPAVLRVIEEALLEVMSSHKIRPGEAVRIPTGAFLPEGADSVVMIEEAKESEGGAVEVFREIEAGEHVLKAGADFKRGETVLSMGHVLRAQDIDMLAVFGLGEVAVARRPMVAIVSLGDELTLSIEDAPPGKVTASHRFLVSNMVSRAGGTPIDLGIAPDDLAEIRATLGE
ncbi:MAG: molybdopterin molybdotransferase MoeA, partial [Candidatus Bathyarchaeia archaeon]